MDNESDDARAAIEMISSIVKAPIEDVIGGVRRLVSERDTTERELAAERLTFSEYREQAVTTVERLRAERDSARKSLKHSEIGYRALRDNLNRRVAELEATIKRALQPCDGCIDGTDKPCTCADELKRVLGESAVGR